MKTYLLILIYVTITLCLELNEDINTFNFHSSFLTSNYTIDFVRNIKPQKCYSNDECPHYSNGCVIKSEMFKNKNIALENNDTIGNFSKEELMNNGIYGFCSYYYYCTENKDSSIQNSNCVVMATSETVDATSYKTYNDTSLIYYDLKPGFVTNNITTVDHCNEDSIKNKYCNSKINISCRKNDDCLSNNCSSDFQCLNSNNFYIYKCENIVNDKNEENNNNNCKKINHEYCKDSSECSSNFSTDGYCLEDVEYDNVHRYDKRNTFLNIIFIGLIIIIILIIVCLCICFKKGKKLCFSRQK